jgi:DNA-binding NtrC family response regulator
VLLLESDRAVHRWLVDTLSSTGLTIHRASDLPSAVIALTTSGPFDAVICGSDFADEIFSTFLRWIRDQSMVIPVVFIAGSKPLKRTSKRCVHLKKPFLSTQLLEALARILPDSGAAWEHDFIGDSTD